MSNQYPGDPTRDQYPDDPRETNRTPTIIAAILAVLLLIAAVVIGWLFATRDSDDDMLTMAPTSPIETTTADSPEPGTVTMTNTISVEETTQTITREPAPPVTTTVASGDNPANACDARVFQEDGHTFVDSLMFCDSSWARGGRYQTDYIRIFREVNGTWQIYQPSGESEITGYPCYDTQAMSAAGAPDALVDQSLDCSAG